MLVGYPHDILTRFTILINHNFQAHPTHIKWVSYNWQQLFMVIYIVIYNIQWSISISDLHQLYNVTVYSYRSMVSMAFSTGFMIFSLASRPTLGPARRGRVFSLNLDQPLSRAGSIGPQARQTDPGDEDLGGKNRVDPEWSHPKGGKCGEKQIGLHQPNIVYGEHMVKIWWKIGFEVLTRRDFSNQYPRMALECVWKSGTPTANSYL